MFDSEVEGRNIAAKRRVTACTCSWDAFQRVRTIEVKRKPRGYPPPSIRGFHGDNAADLGRHEFIMAAKKKAKKGKTAELIISKSRTKGAVKKCNVGSEFYPALDVAVRNLIKEAEARAVGNKRKTLKAVDL